MILQGDLSPAFAGCSRAYAEVHLSNARCLDGRVHVGSPCLLTDSTREGEALRLLTSAPVPSPGAGVVFDALGNPVLAAASFATP